MRFVLCLLIACEAQTPTPAPSNPPAKKAAKKEPPAQEPTEPAKECDPYAARMPAPELIIAPDGLTQTLIALMDSATVSLDIYAYSLTYDALIEAVIATHERGVAVRVILDRDRNDKSRPLLQAAGVPWRDSPEVFNYSHAKTMLIDGKTSVIMSMNFDGYSQEGERNYGIVSQDAGDAEDIAAIFEADWSGGALSLPCTRLIVAPINARERLTQLIATTVNTLDLALMYLSDDALYDAVVARAKDGVHVRVLLADPEWMQYNDDTLRALSQDAPAVEGRVLTSLELHAKLIVSDDRAFIGSENMSANSLDNNREIGAFVSNQEQVDQVRAQFERDWSAGIALP